MFDILLCGVFVAAAVLFFFQRKVPQTTRWMGSGFLMILATVVLALSTGAGIPNRKARVEATQGKAFVVPPAMLGLHFLPDGPVPSKSTTPSTPSTEIIPPHLPPNSPPQK